MSCRRLVWKIENFSCMKDGTISSHDLWWERKIILFASSERISIELKRISSYCNYCNLSIALLNSEGSPLVWREKKDNPQFPIRFDIKKDTIFGSMRDKFLPNDTLIVQLIEWNMHEELLNPTSIFKHSRIILHEEVTKKTFSWNIKNINSLELDPTLGQVELFTIEGNARLSTSRGDELTIQLYFNTSLSVKLSASLTRAQQIKCIISVVDAKGKIIQFVDAKHCFHKKDEVLTCPIPITKGMLMYYRKEYFPNDTLSLLFSCTFGTNEFSHRELKVKGKKGSFVENSHPNVALPLPPNNTISRALMGILEDGLLSDFSFQVQDKTFPVHKAILSSRSPVFRAMFTVDMKEKESSSVDIPDVDADTFQRMLNFIYSDSFEDDMQWESASKLYSVADKYDLEPLKQKCSQNLMSGLCVSSVLEVLLLGDMHQDDNLKDVALDFVARNDKEIVPSERWKRFVEGHPTLALETFQKLLFAGMLKVNGTVPSERLKRFVEERPTLALKAFQKMYVKKLNC